MVAPDRSVDADSKRKVSVGRMNVTLPVQLDKLSFLAWVQGREGRYELAGGRVVMMVGASRGHAVIVMNLAALIRPQIDPQLAVLADFGLDVGENTLRYPDMMVDHAGGGAGDYTATAPVLVGEVLSPSTADVDLGDKAAEYLALPDLEAYLVLAQNEPKAWIWGRRDGRFPPAPQVLAGLDKTIHIPALKLGLPLGALYAGL
jgi:Uma2 family endonuclease